MCVMSKGHGVQIRMQEHKFDFENDKHVTISLLKSHAQDKKRYWTPAVKDLVWELTDAKEGLADLRQSLATRMLRQFDSSYAVWMRAAQVRRRL